MKTKFYHNVFPVIILTGIMPTYSHVLAQVTIHTIDVRNTREPIDLLKYTSMRSPLISAHRGGARAEFPENCIATLENTLQYALAIFEIDPRLTKDSVIVLMHDETLDRTTTGKGKLRDYTFKELKEFRLKDPHGKVTPYQIPTLKETLEWARGKTILVLDDKDVPYAMVASMLNEQKAFNYVLMTVRNAGIAKQCYLLDIRFLFEAYVFDREDISELETTGIPWNHIMAYVGPQDESKNNTLYKELNRRGVKCMVSGARFLDKVFLEGNYGIYKDIFQHGADIIETDLPIQASAQVSILKNKKAKMFKYFGKKEIPLTESFYIPRQAPIKYKIPDGQKILN